MLGLALLLVAHLRPKGQSAVLFPSSVRKGLPGAGPCRGGRGLGSPSADGQVGGGRRRLERLKGSLCPFPRIKWSGNGVPPMTAWGRHSARVSAGTLVTQHPDTDVPRAGGWGCRAQAPHRAASTQTHAWGLLRLPLIMGAPASRPCTLRVGVLAGGSGGTTLSSGHRGDHRRQEVPGHVLSQQDPQMLVKCLPSHPRPPGEEAPHSRSPAWRTSR